MLAVLVRAFTSASRTPYWDIDPLLSWTPETTRLPSMSLLLDALVWLAAGAIVWAEALAGRAIAWRSGALVLAGTTAVFLHGLALIPLDSKGSAAAPAGDFASLLLGSAWAAAMVGAWALWMAARERAIRSAAAFALLGAITLLAVRGGYQVLVEHPRTVAMFDRDPAAALTAQGFEPGSTNALLFERRLRQSEATGSFGLANVFGSFAGAMLAAWAAVAIGAALAARRGLISGGEAGVMAMMAISAAAALAMSASKGGVAAGIVGVACAGACLLIQGTPPRATAGKLLRFAVRWAPALFPALALFAVVARGLIGERISELSLYFRWQYLLAAARIVQDHSLLGVGPASFKDAYLLAKEPTNPEEIESPHSLLFDWAATLGVFGWAWICVWTMWAVQAGAGAVSQSDAPEEEHERSPRGSGLILVGTALGVVGAVFLAIATEWAALGADLLLLMAVAMGLWLFAARIATRLDWLERGLLKAALLGASVALGTHAMIEVTPVQPGSAGLFMALIALAASMSAPRSTSRPRAARRAACLLFLAALCVGAAMLAAESWRARRWEHHLWRAAELARRTGEATREAIERGSPAAGWPCSMVQAAAVAGETATMLSELHLAAAIQPSADEPLWLSVRLRAASATCDRLSAAERAKILEKAADLARSIVGREPASAGAWMRLGQLLRVKGDSLGTQTRAEEIESLRRAAALDPHGLRPALSLARACAAAGEVEEARSWARSALQIDNNLRLDPLKGLNEAERSWLLRAVEGDPAGLGTPP